MDRATDEVVSCSFGLEALSEAQLDQVTALVRTVRLGSGELLE